MEELLQLLRGLEIAFKDQDKPGGVHYFNKAIKPDVQKHLIDIAKLIRSDCSIYDTLCKILPFKELENDEKFIKYLSEKAGTKNEVFTTYINAYGRKLRYPGNKLRTFEIRMAAIFIELVAPISKLIDEQAAKLLELEGQREKTEQQIEQPLQKYDSFDFISRIEVDGLKFTIYYGDHEKDVILPNTFPKCCKNNKPTDRWGLVLRALADKKPGFSVRDRFNVNESFKLFFKENKGIDCGNILDANDKIAVKNISLKSHSESYRRNQLQRNQEYLNNGSFGDDLE
jgi:hypothetical protein